MKIKLCLVTYPSQNQITASTKNGWLSLEKVMIENMNVASIKYPDWVFQISQQNLLKVSQDRAGQRNFNAEY